MDKAQEQLYGRFPRAVGSPNQHIVHSKQEFDAFTETIQGRRNAYASISCFPVGGGVVSDKVSLDLDSAGKESAFSDDMRDDEKVALMRKDTNVAEEVLGEVSEEARKIARTAERQSIPALGVFSGFGIHIHLLFQLETDPSEKMATVARKFRDELDLITLDHKIIGDEQRIMRIPNMRRVHLEDLFDDDAERFECDVWTVPLTRDELAEITPQRLLKLSKEPRPEVKAEARDREPMPFHEEYKDDSREAVTARPDAPSIEGDLDDEGLEWMLKHLLRMPCMYENLLLDPEPPHEIRLNSAVLLFNLGFSVDEVLDLFAQIGWKDWDREFTRRQLKQIYRKGYSDMSCHTLRQEGYCTRQEEPTNCPTYGWSGGECEW